MRPSKIIQLVRFPSGVHGCVSMYASVFVCLCCVVYKAWKLIVQLAKLIEKRRARSAGEWDCADRCWHRRHQSNYYVASTLAGFLAWEAVCGLLSVMSFPSFSVSFHPRCRSVPFFFHALSVFLSVPFSRIRIRAGRHTAFLCPGAVSDSLSSCFVPLDVVRTRPVTVG